MRASHRPPDDFHLRRPLHPLEIVIRKRLRGQGRRARRLQFLPASSVLEFCWKYLSFSFFVALRREEIAASHADHYPTLLAVTFPSIEKFDRVDILEYVRRRQPRVLNRCGGSTGIRVFRGLNNAP